MVFTNVYNPRSEIARKHEYKTTIVKKGASLGANCTIVCGVTINEFAFVGAGAVVRNDVKRFALVVGVPAKQIGWMSRYGDKIDLPLKGKVNGFVKTNSLYILENNSITYIEKLRNKMEFIDLKLQQNQISKNGKTLEKILIKESKMSWIMGNIYLVQK